MEWKTMRLNSAKWRNISPEQLFGFRLQINEEDDSTSKEELSPEVANQNRNRVLMSNGVKAVINLP